MSDLVVPSIGSVTANPASTLTGAQIIDRVRAYLHPGYQDTRNKLSGALTSAAPSAAFAYDLGPIRGAARLSIDLEDIHVWAVTDASKTATIERGQWGTTAAAHSDGTIVLVNPRWSNYDVLSAVNDELSELSSPHNGLFQIRTVDLTYNAAISGYDLTSVATSMISVYEVRFDSSGPANDWPIVRKWSVARNMPTTEFASGMALILHDAAEPGRTIRVRYKAPYTTIGTITDNVEAVSGLHAQAHQVAILGATIRLAAGREVTRNMFDTQGDTRRAEEVPPGAQITSLRGLIALRQQGIEAEAARLAAQYPTRL